MKNYKFNARFRTAVMAVADEMGLEFISTPRQVENGTLMFNDPIGKVKYAMYESGYVRRLVPTTIWQTPYPNKSGYAMYQLNRVIRNAHKSSIWNNKVYNYRGAHRVLAGPDEQLGILVKSVANWRNR
jgi:hypothetical protein